MVPLSSVVAVAGEEEGEEPAILIVVPDPPVFLLLEPWLWLSSSHTSSSSVSNK
jgi:hypothetical protein